MKVLRLLGYSVRRDVTINGCQIDIYARYRTGVITMRLMVECKDYAGTKTVGVGEVKEFAGVVSTVHGTAIDKGLLITTHGFTREAREFAEAACIQTVCFRELATQLVPFDDYLDQVISEFERLDVSQYYIALSASETEEYDVEDETHFQRPLGDTVNRILVENDSNKLALLGNFGTGKSTFCRKYAYDLAKKCKTDTTTRIPIIVSLNDYESKLDIQQLVTNTLQFRYGVRIDLTLCQQLQRLGKFIILFDGFDEMATRVDPDVVRDNLREIDKISRIEENKFILTCRTHYFRDRVHAEILTDFDILYIPEWGKRELAEYLQIRFGSEWEKYLNKIHGTHNLAELAQTPLFMEMLAETLPRLGEKVRRSALYQTYTNTWIRDQSKRRGARLGTREREKFVKELSLKMFFDGKSTCHYSEFTTMIHNQFKTINAAQIDYLDNDVRTCTFMARNKDGHYFFRHKSFMEFFVAQSLARDILNGEPNYLSKSIITLEVRGFLVDILIDNPPSEILKKWLQKDKDKILRENCLALSIGLKLDLGDTKLNKGDDDIIDEEVYSHFLQGDTGAFEQLFGKLQPSLIAYLKKQKIGDSLSAEDIATDVWIKIWQYRDRIDQRSDLRPYIFRVAKQILVDSYRREHSQRRGGHLIPTVLEDVPEESVNKPENSIMLKESINRLSSREKQVITGLYIEQRTFSELAEELDLSLETVRSISYRAKERLREYLRNQ